MNKSTKQDVIRLSILIGIIFFAGCLVSGYGRTEETIILAAQTTTTPSPSPSHSRDVNKEAGRVVVSEFGLEIDNLKDKAKGWQEVAEYIKEVWGDRSYVALRLAHCESRFAKDRVNINKGGSKDFGPFQVNQFWAKHYGNGFETDWKENVRVAKDIADKHGFAQWVCFNKYSQDW